MNAYFDWAATAPSDPEVLDEYDRVARKFWHNPSSAHADGRSARTILEDARKRAAAALGSDPKDVFFTSGGTEADHIPLLSLLFRPVKGTIAYSAIEHSAITEQVKSLERAGWKTIRIPSTADGFVTPEAVLASLTDDTAYVAVMAVNNETGAIQPVTEIAKALADRYRGKRKPHFHVDAVQAIGKIPLNITSEGIDSIAASAHKICGPRGVGILRLGRQVDPFIRGGGQEYGMRPGTENVAGAAAFALALELAVARLKENEDGIAHARELFERLISVNGITPIPASRVPGDSRFSPYIAQFTNDRLPGEVLVRALSDRGISISTGSACSTKKQSRPVLEAMHVAPDARQNAFRVSTGHATTQAEIDALVKAISDLFGVI